METLTELLTKADKITCLITKAQEKFDTTANSPYYDTFSNENERKRDLIKMQKVICRLQNWFYNTIEKARECKIG